MSTLYNAVENVFEQDESEDLRYTWALDDNLADGETIVSCTAAVTESPDSGTGAVHDKTNDDSSVSYFFHQGSHDTPLERYTVKLTAVTSDANTFAVSATHIVKPQ